MDTVAIWTKKLCANFIQGGTSSANDNNNGEVDDKDFFNYPILDLGTGNGLLLQALAKQGYYAMSKLKCFVIYIHCRIVRVY
jgi:2-polyprenyl-3-methyl-5-hydroxy-6-metoxy-1,4-benzoquinol methylase